MCGVSRTDTTAAGSSKWPWMGSLTTARAARAWVRGRGSGGVGQGVWVRERGSGGSAELRARACLPLTLFAGSSCDEMKVSSSKASAPSMAVCILLAGGVAVGGGGQSEGGAGRWSAGCLLTAQWRAEGKFESKEEAPTRRWRNPRGGSRAVHVRMCRLTCTASNALHLNAGRGDVLAGRRAGSGRFRGPVGKLAGQGASRCVSRDRTARDTCESVREGPLRIVTSLRGVSHDAPCRDSCPDPRAGFGSEPVSTRLVFLWSPHLPWCRSFGW